MATARVEARYPREMKKQRAGVRNERRFRQLAVVCPKCKKLVSPPDLLAEHFARCSFGCTLNRACSSDSVQVLYNSGPFRRKFCRGIAFCFQARPSGSAGLVHSFAVTQRGVRRALGCSAQWLDAGSLSCFAPFDGPFETNLLRRREPHRCWYRVALQVAVAGTVVFAAFVLGKVRQACLKASARVFPNN